MPTKMLIVYLLIFLTPLLALVYIILALPFMELLMPYSEIESQEQLQTKL